MHLIKKVTFWHSMLTAGLLLITGCLMFFSLRIQVEGELEERLSTRKQELIRQFDQVAGLDSIGFMVQLQKVTANPSLDTRDIFADTIIFDHLDNEEAAYQTLTFFHPHKGALFKVTIRQSSAEQEDMIESIFISLILAFIALIFLFPILNTAIMSKLWHPFLLALNKAENFDIHKLEPLNLSTPGIEEFARLNETLEKMTNRIITDFANLKEFTANAAHEFQTPVAVILSQLELLLDTDNLSEEQVRSIQNIHTAANKLNQLNKGLLLLTRIEGDTYVETETIDIPLELEKSLKMLEEMIDLKGITLTCNFESPLLLNMNPNLCQILISVLLNNAVNHNISDGKIHVQTYPNRFVISNSGQSLSCKPESLFERFKKGNQAASSLGLGLSIAKKICDHSKLHIQYTSDQEKHFLAVTDRSGIKSLKKTSILF